MLLHVVIVVGKGWGGSDSMSDVSAPIMSAQNQHIYFRRVEENFFFCLLLMNLVWDSPGSLGRYPLLRTGICTKDILINEYLHTNI